MVSLFTDTLNRRHDSVHGGDIECRFLEETSNVKLGQIREPCEEIFQCVSASLKWSGLCTNTADRL